MHYKENMNNDIDIIDLMFHIDNNLILNKMLNKDDDVESKDKLMMNEGVEQQQLLRMQMMKMMMMKVKMNLLMDMMNR